MSQRSSFPFYAVGSGGGPVIPRPRTNLPLFAPWTDIPTAAHPFDSSRPVLSAGGDILVPRGNFSGVRVPGAPGVPGGVNATVPGGDTSETLSYHLDRYPNEWRPRIIEAHAVKRSFTHFTLSPGHALAMGDANLDRYIDGAFMARDAGMWVQHRILGGGEGDGPLQAHDRDWNYWQATVTAILDRLYNAGVLDICDIGWQMDGWNVPGKAGIIPIMEGILAYTMPKGIPTKIHWITDACAWWDPSDTGTSSFTGRPYPNRGGRFAFQQFFSGFLTGHNWQGTPSDPWPPPTTFAYDLNFIQGRLADVLRSLHGCANPFGGQMGLTVSELTAEWQFDGPPTWTEERGNMLGYLALCAHDGTLYPDGFDNGATLSSGQAV